MDDVPIGAPLRPMLPPPSQALVSESEARLVRAEEPWAEVARLPELLPEEPLLDVPDEVRALEYEGDRHACALDTSWDRATDPQLDALLHLCCEGDEDDNGVADCRAIELLTAAVPAHACFSSEVGKRQLAIYRRLAAYARTKASANRPPLYEALGCDPRASCEELRRGYRREALRWHPDKHVHADGASRAAATARFKELQAAWTILSNRELRAEYDEWCQQCAGLRADV
jgi:hypothetical protein